MILCLCGMASARGFLVEGFVNAASPEDAWDFRSDWSVHGLAQLDQMVAAGLGFGYEAVPAHPAGLIDSRLQVRLPLGRQALPYLDVEAGAGLRPMLEDSYFAWKMGGGMDLKLGDRSSILVGMGKAVFGRWYARIGLLLEF